MGLMNWLFGTLNPPNPSPTKQSTVEAQPSEPESLTAESVKEARARYLAGGHLGFRPNFYARLLKDESVQGMTEEAWHSDDDPLAMLIFLSGRASGRKFRLFAAACARDQLIRSDPLDVEIRHPKYGLEQAILYAEICADGGISEYQNGGWMVGLSVGSVTTEEDIAHSALGFDADVGLWTEPVEEIVPKMIASYLTHPAHYIREIFGNPFRPVAFAAEWRTSTAVAVARSMYESRDFTAMSLLADALEDAGCDNPDILSHCRSEGPHVRGCWVVDLVLDKN